MPKFPETIQTTSSRPARRRRQQRQSTPIRKEQRISKLGVLGMMSAVFLSLAARRTLAWMSPTTSTRLLFRQQQQRRTKSFQSIQQPITRCFSTASENDSGNGKGDKKQTPKKKPPKNKSQRKGKIRINEKLSSDQASANLAAAFDELARKEGFGSSKAFYADSSTFEDDFDEDDLEEFYDNEEVDEVLEDLGEDGDTEEYSLTSDMDGILDDDGGPVGQGQMSKESMEARIAAAKPVKGSTHLKDEELEDLDFLDFGSTSTEDDMEARLAAAQRDLDLGRVTVDPRLSDLTKDDMRRLGFRQELNPFEGTETPRQEQYKLITDAMVCSACGSDFQAQNPSKPGYLPPEKYEIQMKMGKIEELQRLKERAETADWTPEDEVEYLLRTSDGEGETDGDADDIDIDAFAEELGIDLAQELSKKKVICKRCHGLQNFGKVEDALRPGWTEEPLMSQESFRDLLKPLSEKPCVLIAIVDLFDFSGSVLPELDAIAGENPVILAANKADLLPSQMGQQRAENWVRRELEYMGIKSLANIGGAVRLISCKTGVGVNGMLNKARKLADEMDCDVYIVGAANAGKSTLMNYILRGQEQEKDKMDKRKKRAGNANAFKGALTTSPLPGTTLKFIKIDLGGGRNLYDTPGLLVPGTLTQLLTPDELKIAVPTKQVEPITFRVPAGKCVQVGGLARISMIGDAKPFLFTFFVANQIKLHPTDISRADDFVAKHVGGMLTPPLEPGPERMEQLGEFETHFVEIQGTGWKEAAADITLTGLGWVAVTGAGTAQVEIKVPKGIGVQVRPPLMPYDIWEVTAKYTGSKAIRKSSKSVTGKRRKGVGRN